MVQDRRVERQDQQDLALKLFLKAEDPAASIDPMRLAKIEARLFEQLALMPQNHRLQDGHLNLAPEKKRAFYRAHAQDRGRLWRVLTSHTSRFAASATLCLLLGLWVGIEGRVLTQTQSISTVASSNAVVTADTGVSANLPLLAMASPWQEWVSMGEER